MKALDFAALRGGEEFDFVVVGSGFGGSVAALRLAEKGYSVAVLEAGRAFADEDFPRSNWDLPRYLWLPRLGCWGLQRITPLEHVLVLSGAGLGGGSLVYANTLLEPGSAFYRSCSALGPRWAESLKPHFETAKRMLGAAAPPRLFPADEALERTAAGLGRSRTFHRPPVGVHFGPPGALSPDPYFGGRGPARRGCTFCGSCMVGCREGAKNTLVKNYLHLAADLGARFFTKTTAVRLEGRPGGGVLVECRRSGWGLERKTLRARGLVLAAGVLGTLRLLLEPSNRLGPLPRRLGREVRTNSEALLGALLPRGAQDQSRGVAIASGAWADEETHLEAVRYPAGSDAMALLSWPPVWPSGWSRRAVILLAMQTRDTRLRLTLGRGSLRTAVEPGARAPAARLPAAERFQAAFCRETGAAPQRTLFDAWLGKPATAHILGGACRAADAASGCTDEGGKLFGRDDVWILDGSAVPANPGVNPSLTITALAEQAMAAVPARSRA